MHFRNMGAESVAAVGGGGRRGERWRRLPDVRRFGGRSMRVQWGKVRQVQGRRRSIGLSGASRRRRSQTLGVGANGRPVA